MAVLIVGLVLFLGVHSLRIWADGWRTGAIARVGAGPWKGIYALVSIAGFVVLIWGFGLARANPVALYTPAVWLKHANSLFTLIAFVLVFAAYVPANHFKAALGHPMLAGVILWSGGHLLATGMLRDVVLFGAFFVWGLVDFLVARRRDRRQGVSYPAATGRGDAIAVVVGIAAWAAFAFWLHVRWIGVDPFA
jgi:uncharacterized membrane protein